MNHKSWRPLLGAAVLLIALALGNRLPRPAFGSAELAIAGPSGAPSNLETPSAGLTPALSTPDVASPAGAAPQATPAVLTPSITSAEGSTPAAPTSSGTPSTATCTGAAPVAGTPGVNGVTPVIEVTPTATPAALAQRALDRINCYRALEGVGPLTLDPTLNRSTAAHVNYYVLNAAQGNLGSLGIHDETSGQPGFTGADSDTRAKAAGSTDSYVDENIGTAGSPEATVDWFVNSVNHRENLLHPSAIHLGFGSSDNPPIQVYDIGVTDARPSAPLPIVYPADHQIEVPTSVDLEESPDPAPGVPRPLGYPVTISFGISDTVSFTAWSMTDASGQSVPLVTAQKQWLRTLALIPTQPLSPGTTYTVNVSGTANGQPFVKAWSFTTTAESATS